MLRALEEKMSSLKCHDRPYFAPNRQRREGKELTEDC